MAGNMIPYVTSECPLPGGDKIIRGVATCTSNACAGMELDLTNYFSNAGTVTVVCSSANGHSLEHNHGSAAEGIVYIKRCDNTGIINTALIAGGEDWSGINVAFIAFGKNK